MSRHDKVRREFWFNLKYLGTPRWDTGTSPPELLDFIRESPPGRALDLGCGTGTNLLTLARAGWEVTGVEQAGLSVLKARRKFRQAGLNARIIRGRVTADLKMDKGFDLILDIGCYHNLTVSERSVYQQLLMKRLVPGGTFLFYVHFRKDMDSFHGVDQGDLAKLAGLLKQTWRSNQHELHSDGSIRIPSIWVRYDRIIEKGPDQ